MALGAKESNSLTSRNSLVPSKAPPYGQYAFQLSSGVKSSADREPDTKFEKSRELLKVGLVFCSSVHLRSKEIFG